MTIEEDIKNMMEHQKALEEENIKLKKDLDMREKTLRIITTEGINTKDIASIEDASIVLDLSPDEMHVLSVRNPGEYLKQVYRKFNTLMVQRKADLEEKGLNLNGDRIGDMFKEFDDYLNLVPDVSAYAQDPKLIEDYPKKIKVGREAIKLLFDWQPTVAQVLSYHAAHSDLIMHYAGDEVERQAKLKVLNVEQKIQKDYEQEQKKVEEEKNAQEAPPTPPEPKENAMDVLIELSKKQIEMLGNIASSMQKRASETFETEDNTDEIENESEENAKKSKKR